VPDAVAGARGPLAALAILVAASGVCAETIRERATGAEFPASVGFVHAGREYDLRLTGLAVRRVAFFKVYGMAHYAEAPDGRSGRALLDHVLSDGTAKQVTLHFARDIDGQRISESLVDSLRRNASEDALRDAQGGIERFAEAVRHDVRKGERFTVRWLPGGTTVCLFNGQQILVLHDIMFGRLLWAIWFGDRPVVDRDALLGADSARRG
jgi:hypothetical protein